MRVTSSRPGRAQGRQQRRAPTPTTGRPRHAAQPAARKAATQFGIAAKSPQRRGHVVDVERVEIQRGVAAHLRQRSRRATARPHNRRPSPPAAAGRSLRTTKETPAPARCAYKAFSCASPSSPTRITPGGSCVRALGEHRSVAATDHHQPQPGLVAQARERGHQRGMVLGRVVAADGQQEALPAQPVTVEHGVVGFDRIEVIGAIGHQREARRVDLQVQRQTFAREVRHRQQRQRVARDAAEQPAVPGREAAGVGLGVIEDRSVMQHANLTAGERRGRAGQVQQHAVARRPGQHALLPQRQRHAGRADGCGLDAPQLRQPRPCRAQQHPVAIHQHVERMNQLRGHALHARRALRGELAVQVDVQREPGGSVWTWPGGDAAGRRTA